MPLACFVFTVFLGCSGKTRLSSQGHMRRTGRYRYDDYGSNASETVDRTCALSRIIHVRTLTYSPSAEELIVLYFVKAWMEQGAISLSRNLECGIPKWTHVLSYFLQSSLLNALFSLGQRVATYLRG